MQECRQHPQTMHRTLRRQIESAEGLVPDDMFDRMLILARRNPDRFADCASRLFGAMATGDDIDLQAVACFNGGLFDDNEILPRGRRGIQTALNAAALD